MTADGIANDLPTDRKLKGDRKEVIERNAYIHIGDVIEAYPSALRLQRNAKTKPGGVAGEGSEQQSSNHLTLCPSSLRRVF